jgi:hypothetical protein
MKYALILNVNSPGGNSTLEESPTVLAIGATASIPLNPILQTLITVGSISATDWHSIMGSLTTNVVRVEDAVIPGDTISQSSDVWHKTV